MFLEKWSVVGFTEGICGTLGTRVIAEEWTPRSACLYYSSSLSRPARLVRKKCRLSEPHSAPHVARRGRSVEDTKKSLAALAKLNMRQISARSVPWLKACPFLEGRFVTLSALIVTASDAADDAYLVE